MRALFVFVTSIALAGSVSSVAQDPVSYAIPGKPSQLLERRAELMVLAQQVEKDLRAELARFGAEDPRVRQGNATALFQIAVLRQDAEAARRALIEVRTTLDDPTSRAMAGLVSEPYVLARTAPGTDVHRTFRALMSARLAALPFQDVEFTLGGVGAQFRTTTSEQIRGAVETTLDPQAAGGRLTRDAAVRLLALAANRDVLLAVKDDLAVCLAELFERHKGDTVPYDPKIGTPRAAVRGATFGQAAPGMKPERFAPAVLDALSKWVVGIAFSPDGAECFLTVGGPSYGGSRIFHAALTGGTWSAFSAPPALAGFITDGEAHFAPDGRTLYFTGKRPGERLRLWAMQRAGTSWARPEPLPALSSLDGDSYRGKSTSDGTWYFGLNRGGMMQIYRIAAPQTGTATVEKLGTPINENAFDGDPCVAPDGRWLVFNSGRTGSRGGSDLYVSFTDGKGGWRAPVNLGAAFNSPYDEYGAHLSPDGRTFFWTRHTPRGAEIWWVAVAALDAVEAPTRTGA